MNEVKVKRTELLDKLKKNRASHRDLFLKAQKVYREDVIAELDRMLEEARRGKPIRRVINLPEPQDHTADYDRVIAMLEMSVERNTVVSDREFDMYVMDNWSWKESARATNMIYAAKAGL